MNPNKKAILATCFGVAVLIAVAVVVALTTEPKAVSRPESSVGAADVPFNTWTPYTPTYTPLPPPPKPVVLAGDFSVSLKITSKKCFGSIGCNVTVQPEIKYLGTLTTEIGCDLTYAVLGDESGEVIETAEHVTGDSYRVRDTFLSTKSTKVVPTATMIGVDCK